jgi:hypothetical protein
MAYLYRHIRLDKNEVFYIGIAEKKNKKFKSFKIEFERAFQKICRNIHWKRIVKKTKYEVEIMLDELTWEEACKKETEFIHLYGRKDLGLGPLVNMTDGGDGSPGHIRTAEAIAKSVANTDYSKIHTPEIHAKRAATTDFSYLSDPELIAKRVANTNYKDPARIEKLRKSVLNKNHPWRTKKGRKKCNENHKKPIIQYNRKGEFVKEWKSAKDASIKLKIGNQSIGLCCRGKAKTAYGYIWKFK